MVKFTTTINAFTKEVRIKAGEVCFEIQFTDLDEWYSFEFEGQVYDVHFHYDEKLWFNIYRNVKTEGYEKNIIKNDIRIVLTDLEFNYEIQIH